jgi:Family of unknown function (DUF6804)
MLTKIMKWVSSAVLLLAGLRLTSILLGLVVCVSGILAVTQAVRDSKYLWAAGFFLITVLFNPVVPVLLSRKTFLWLDWVCLMTFLISLAALKRQSTLFRPSITSRTQGSESV